MTTNNKARMHLNRLSVYYGLPIGMLLVHKAYSDRNITAKQAERLTRYVRSRKPK